MPICIIGSIAFDTIKTPYGEREKCLGGSATYAGTAASHFTDLSVVSIVGKDFPQEYLDFLNSRGIDTSGVVVGNGDTFHWTGYYEADMGQAFTVATDLNVIEEFDPVIPDRSKGTNIVFCANIDPVLQKKAIQQFSSPKLVVLDTMNFWIESKYDELRDVLKLTDVLIINDQEARQLTQIDNIVQALPKVVEMGPNRVIIKKGEHGSIMYNGTDYFILPAFPLHQLVDPTGAGDSFAGALVGSLAQDDAYDDEAFRRGIIRGTLMSSLTVQGFSVESLKNADNALLDKKYTDLKRFVALPTTL